MDFQTAIKTCFSKYAVFEGRASRSEYWYFTLFCLLGGTVAGLLDKALSSENDLGPVGIIFSLITLVPGLAVATRRLHDINRGAWWVFVQIAMLPFLIAAVAISSLFGIALIAFIIWLVYLYSIPGDQGANQYGDPPLASQSDTYSGTAVAEENNLALLEKLFEMQKRGILTEEEFQSRKSQLLGLQNKFNTAAPPEVGSSEKVKTDPLPVSDVKISPPTSPSEAGASMPLERVEPVNAALSMTGTTKSEASIQEQRPTANENEPIKNVAHHHLSRIEALERLAELRESGVFTDAEVAAAKARLLGQVANEAVSLAQPKPTKEAETPSVVSASGPPANLAESHLSRIEALERLAELRETGVFGEEEFEAAKARVLRDTDRESSSEAVSLSRDEQTRDVDAVVEYLAPPPTAWAWTLYQGELTQSDEEKRAVAIMIEAASKAIIPKSRPSGSEPSLIEPKTSQIVQERSKRDIVETQQPALESKNEAEKIVASGASLDDFDHRIATLKQLAELRDSGILTQEEFEREKMTLLRS